jgi:hypothetical protein
MTEEDDSKLLDLLLEKLGYAVKEHERAKQNAEQAQIQLQQAEHYLDVWESAVHTHRKDSGIMAVEEIGDLPVLNEPPEGFGQE